MEQYENKISFSIRDNKEYHSFNQEIFFKNDTYQSQNLMSWSYIK